MPKEHPAALTDEKAKALLRPNFEYKTLMHQYVEDIPGEWGCRCKIHEMSFSEAQGIGKRQNDADQQAIVQWLNDKGIGCNIERREKTMTDPHINGPRYVSGPWATQLTQARGHDTYLRFPGIIAKELMEKLKKIFSPSQEDQQKDQQRPRP